MARSTTTFASANEQTKLRALSAGATDFLLKPFEQIEALLRIANLLEIRHLHLQMEMQRLAYEEAVRTCSSELRHAKAALAKKKWSDSNEAAEHRYSTPKLAFS